MSEQMSRNLYVVAALLDAANCAREGDRETAQARIARAVALLKGESAPAPDGLRTTGPAVRQVTHGALAAWQARRVAEHIEANLATEICVEDLARILGLSIGHFSRAFKRTFGVTPHMYLIQRRVELAQSLMLTTPRPLSEIALTCGMSDQSHFTRIFRRVVGETPYLWRRRRWQPMKEPDTLRAPQPSPLIPETALMTPA